ncbi:transglycosylase SLT domain-containing protein [Sulfuricystis multivorans]|uniref:transglycosylase SLT domain-containing protein n=1 Tax=Sulfuricystis multivorans TaxID=2211108 RepID=UPI000F83AA6D|nr:transglycosylase SLT domain-containing protein [Sulfuricystis multivorans]
MNLILRLTVLVLVVLAGGCATLPGSVAQKPDRSAEAAVQPSPPQTISEPGAAAAPELPASALPKQIITENTPPPLIDLTAPPEDLWQRIRRGFGMPDLHDPLVAEHQSWYLNRPEMLRRIFERGRRYLYHIVEELETRGMPTELALLPMVESAFNPRAVSRARAMGLWQFIPSTGKTYNLDQNWWADERRDIIASTDAALTYLQKIYEMHGDWHLALASYNWGEGAVGRAIAKNQAKGLPTDYSSLTMPAETRNYVPKLQALKNIVAQPELFGIYLPPIPNRPYFETVAKPARIDVALAAHLAGISVEEFVALNPAYHRPVIDGNQAGEELLLPVEKIGTFLTNLERYEAEDKPLSNWKTHTLKRGETIAKVAARFKLSEARLRQINGITPRVRIHPGFTLLIPRPGSQAAENLAHALPEPPPLPKESATPSRKGKTVAARFKGKPTVTVKPSAKPAVRAKTKTPPNARTTKKKLQPKNPS